MIAVMTALLSTLMCAHVVQCNCAADGQACNTHIRQLFINHRYPFFNIATMNRIDSLINNMIVKSGFAKHRSKCIHSGDMAHFADQFEQPRVNTGIARNVVIPIFIYLRLSSFLSSSPCFSKK